MTEVFVETTYHCKHDSQLIERQKSQSVTNYGLSDVSIQAILNISNVNPINDWTDKYSYQMIELSSGRVELTKGWADDEDKR